MGEFDVFGFRNRYDIAKQAKCDLREELQNEIEKTTEYLNTLVIIEVFECYECGRETTWSELDENEGYCNNCFR